jgi:hypothetical protein
VELGKRKPGVSEGLIWVAVFPLHSGALFLKGSYSMFNFELPSGPEPTWADPAREEKEKENKNQQILTIFP